MSTTSDKDEVQGEGDVAAARRYDKSAEAFATSGQVDPAAHRAAPQTPGEAEELRRAEQVGQSHSKGEGPLVSDKARP